MKKNRIWFVFVGLFCLVTSGATVYATSYKTQNEVGVRFVDSNSTSATSTSISTSSTTSSTTSSSSSSSSSSSNSVVQSDSSLPETKSSEKQNGLFFCGIMMVEAQVEQLVIIQTINFCLAQAIWYI